MNINKLIYDVREGLKEYSDDSNLDDRYIIYLYNIKRSKYLRREMNNFQKTTDLTNQQTLCLDTNLINSNECGLDITCNNILRTKNKLPKILELNTKTSISRIAPSDKLSKPFNFISREKALYIGDSSFPSSIYAFLHDDNYIYIISDSDSVKLLECISITAVFEDPLSLKDYKNCCNCDETPTCYDIDVTDYPLQSYLIDLIRREIIEELVGLKNIKEDKNNNSDDN